MKVNAPPSYATFLTEILITHDTFKLKISTLEGKAPVCLSFYFACYRIASHTH